MPKKDWKELKRIPCTVHENCEIVTYQAVVWWTGVLAFFTEHSSSPFKDNSEEEQYYPYVDDVL